MADSIIGSLNKCVGTSLCGNDDVCGRERCVYVHCILLFESLGYMRQVGDVFKDVAMHARERRYARMLDIPK